MEKHRRRSNSRRPAVVRGGGLISGVINKAIDHLPFEAHVPGGYRWCGPGTKVAKRLARGDKGINPLDEACKLHDIEYSNFKDSDNRRRADKDLAERAWRRFKASDASLGEKAVAWAVTTTMKAKSKIGGGRRKKKNSGRGLYLKPYKKTGQGQKTKKCTKKGGVLPLIPIFAGLSALGSLAGGASAVAKVITDSKNAKKNLAEIKRHNLAMEGRGVYLKPYEGRGKKKKSSNKLERKKKSSSR